RSVTYVSGLYPRIRSPPPLTAGVGRHERALSAASCRGASGRDLMRTWVGLIALVGLALSSPCDARAQPARVPRIGYLVTHPEWSHFFQTAVTHVGYVEGTSLLVERRASDLTAGQLRAVAQDLVGLRVDLIFTDSTPAALALKSSTDRVP